MNPNSLIVLLSFLICPLLLFGQEDEVSVLTDQLYSIENFQFRLGTALETNADFQAYAEDEDFVRVMGGLARETALPAYAGTIRAMLQDRMTESEVDSLIQLMNSPYGDIIRKFSELDNEVMEPRLSNYVSEIVAATLDSMHVRDSLLFALTSPYDLSTIMDGSYTSTLPYGTELKIVRTGDRQVESSAEVDVEFGIKWLTNNKYVLSNREGNVHGFTKEVTVNIYEVDGNVFRYVFKMPDGTYLKDELVKQSHASYAQEILSFQTGLNHSYYYPATSPLPPAKLTAFRELGGHDFFATDPAMRVTAELEVLPEDGRAELVTSNESTVDYRVYGKATFRLRGEPVTLTVLQSLITDEDGNASEHLFVPFTDRTSGETTYGGGRYLDVRIPEDPSRLVLDFNKAYQPYCAYTDGYACPVPPAENFIDLAVTAGVRQIGL